MNREEIYRQFEELDKRASLGGGVDKIEKQHASGRMTARERIDMLLDKGSFNELDKFVNHRCTNFGMEKKQIAGDGMVTGYGKIDGRPVFVYAYDFTAHGGSLSETNAAKIVKVQQLALKKRRSRHRPERLGRRTHPRRGEQPCRICLYFLSEHYRLRCYPADFRHLGSLCRRSLLLTSTNRFYLYGKREEPHVHHRPGCGEDCD